MKSQTVIGNHRTSKELPRTSQDFLGPPRTLVSFYNRSTNLLESQRNLYKILGKSQEILGNPRKPWERASIRECRRRRRRRVCVGADALAPCPRTGLCGRPATRGASCSAPPPQPRLSKAPACLDLPDSLRIFLGLCYDFWDFVRISIGFHEETRVLGRPRRSQEVLGSLRKSQEVLVSY